VKIFAKSSTALDVESEEEQPVVARRSIRIAG
jgi:hypothetical protein